MSRQLFGVGNADAQTELAGALGSTGGSFLLLGPAGVGKHTIARAFAAAFTCLEPKQNQPCGRCAVCRLRVTLPDVNILEPATYPLSIDAIRALKAGLSLKPFVGDRRAVILDGFETATTEAQNALLKILEEPPAGVVFLVVASHSGSVLPTVQSRTRLIRFQPVSSAEISAWLVRQGTLEPEANRISIIALGRPGLARRLADRTTISLTLATLQSLSVAQRFEEVRAATKEATPIDCQDMVADWLLALRSELLRLVTGAVSGAQGVAQAVKRIRQLTNITRQFRQDSGASASLLLESFIAILP